MAITLPGWLEAAFGLLGFVWPDIDEDDLRDLATSLRRMSTELDEHGSDALRTLTQTNGEVSAESYAALVEHWTAKAHGHVTELAEVCELMAAGLDVAAALVEAIKIEIIAAVGALAAQITADTIGAFVTFGATEAEAVAATAITRRVVGGLINRIEAEVEARLLNDLLGGLRARLDAALERLLYEGMVRALA